MVLQKTRVSQNFSLWTGLLVRIERKEKSASEARRGETGERECGKACRQTIEAAIPAHQLCTRFWWKPWLVRSLTVDEFAVLLIRRHVIAISISDQQGNMCGESFQKALGNSLRDFPHKTGLKAEQERCIKSIAGKQDVFGILPTGFVDRERSPSFPQSHAGRATIYIHAITPLAALDSGRV